MDEFDPPPPDQSYGYRQDGSAVEVFVVDSGIERSNREFTDSTGDLSRAAPGMDLIGCYGAWCDAVEADCMGHGTHVSAIIGGRTFGIAKDVTIVPMQWTCGGFDPNRDLWLRRAFEMILFTYPATEPNTAVVNLSGANLERYALDEGSAHIRQAVVSLAARDNILIVQSAGNFPNEIGDDIYACDRTFGDESKYSDAAADAIARILVVGGTDEDNWRWQTFHDPGPPPVTDRDYPLESCYDSCVDIWAPAAHVVSAWPDDDDLPPEEAVCRLSGTSMAAPHVSGIAAMILEERRTLTVDQLRSQILFWAESGAINSDSETPIGDSPNLLAKWTSAIVFGDGFETGGTDLWD